MSSALEQETERLRAERYERNGYSAIDKLRYKSLEDANKRLFEVESWREEIGCLQVILRCCSELRISPMKWIIQKKELGLVIENISVIELANPSLEEHQCPKCSKKFKTKHALCGHQIAHKNEKKH
jgi:hypothetical protein